MAVDDSPISLYLHIPFCTHRCGYCDFNTYAGLSDLIPQYVAALQEEIRALSQMRSTWPAVHTIYFGGGTPSLLPASSVKEILDTIRGLLPVEEDAEITLEVNPGTISRDYCQQIREAGTNRISMGVQSSRPEELRLLERTHGYEDAINAVRDCRIAGFENLSVDLIFGLPDTRLEHWKHNLDHALRLEPDHISLYALSIEHSTPLGNQMRRGLVPELDPDLAASMYEWTEQVLNQKGFDHYEISNWARTPVHRSRHNVQYWRNGTYLGLGAGAHGYVGGFRTLNALSPSVYIERLLQRDKSLVGRFPKTPATVRSTKVSSSDEMGETLMMGLRLLQDGISRAQFYGRFNIELDEKYREVISTQLENGLLEDLGDRIRLTEKGRLLGNQVFHQFL